MQQFELSSVKVQLLKVDLAKTMAEIFHKADDANKYEVMDLKEFKTGCFMENPVTAKIFQIKKIDAILELM